MSSHDSYDELPYDSIAFSDTHPSHLYAVGRLFGLAPTDVSKCRVLELGCASGGNIIPMGFYLPESEFIGVELSALQAQMGQTTVRELGLPNLRIEHMDVMNISESFGKFDYIIAHGIYSWVPTDVQNKIMSLCQRLLTPNGLAYISYNVKPGWNIRSVTRDVLMYATKTLSTPSEKLARARETLAFMHHGQKHLQSPASEWMHYETTRLIDAPSSYLYHEYLEANNEALLFSTFIERSTQYNLKYVGDTDIHTMFISTLGDKVLPLFDGIDDLLAQEQYSDFLRMRPFRQSILCHESATLTREIDLAIFNDFFIAADLNCAQTLSYRKPKPQLFRSASGRELSVSQPITKAALVVLYEQYPNGFTIDELCLRAQSVLKQHGVNDHPDDKEHLISEIFHLFLYRGVRLTTVKSEYPTSTDAAPLANALARTQEKTGHVTGPHHIDLTLDAFSQLLVELCDGTNSENDMMEKCVAAWRESEALQKLIDVANDEKRARVRIQLNIRSLLKRFARHGIFC